MHISPKKYLGQHFLQDKNLAHKIVGSLSKNQKILIEVGPGTGILTGLLIQQQTLELYVVEIDADLATYLRKTYPMLRQRIITADFLKFQCSQLGKMPITIIGNFPYNITSQIFFKVLANRQQVQEVVGMIQKEVAERLVATTGSKAYGILSVLLQAFYKLEYLFTVGPQVFIPRPKVHSAVIRLYRNDILKLDCDENLFFKVVKIGFQQRRKILRNALKPLFSTKKMTSPLLTKRAEQLTVADFVTLTNCIAAG